MDRDVHFPSVDTGCNTTYSCSRGVSVEIEVDVATDKGIGFCNSRRFSPSSVTRESRIKTICAPLSMRDRTVVGNSAFVPESRHFQRRWGTVTGATLTESSSGSYSSNTEESITATTLLVSSTSSMTAVTTRFDLADVVVVAACLVFNVAFIISPLAWRCDL